MKLCQPLLGCSSKSHCAEPGWCTEGEQRQTGVLRLIVRLGGIRATDKDIKRLKREKCEGKIVMFDRGQLDFTIMAACFQNLAAIGLLVINNTQGPGEPPLNHRDASDPLIDLFACQRFK